MGTLTGTYVLPDGTPETGAITARLTARVIETDTPRVYTEGPITAYLDETGSFTLELVPTDAAAIAAEHLSYEITERVSSRPVRVYWVQLLGTGPWRIEELAVYDSPPPTVLRYEMGPQGERGERGLQGERGERGLQGERGLPGPSGGVNSYYWLFGGTAVADPGTGRLAINGTGGSPRVLSISKTDADGTLRDLLLLLPGDTITVTDAPDVGGVVTGWARYALTGDPVDQGTWVRVDAIRTDASGTPTPPPIDTRLRVIASLASGGDLYPLRSDIWAAGAESVSPVVTAVDPAVGRLDVGGVPMGDTGWRDVAGLLQGDWVTAFPVYLRRVGAMVTWATRELNRPLSGNYAAVTIPVGFQARAIYGGLGVLLSGATGTQLITNAASPSSLYVVSYTGGNKLTGSVSWMTADPWPTTLPGTQVTPPAGQATILPMPEEPPT